jgi:hypothetical protein
MNGSRKNSSPASAAAHTGVLVRWRPRSYWRCPAIQILSRRCPALNRRAALACSLALTLIVALVGLAAATNAGWLGGRHKAGRKDQARNNQPGAAMPSVIAEYVLIDPPAGEIAGSPNTYGATVAAGVGKDVPGARFAQGNATFTATITPRSTVNARSTQLTGRSRSLPDMTATPARPAVPASTPLPSGAVPSATTQAKSPPAAPTNAPATTPSATRTATSTGTSTPPTRTPRPTRTEDPELEDDWRDQ